MNQLKFLLLAVFITGLFTSGISEEETGKKYVEDFNALVTSLTELHPILYRNIGKEEFDKDVKEISERLLHTQSKYRAIYMIQELIYKIGSAHAGNLSVYSIQSDTTITKVLPFSVFIINKEIYIKKYPADTTYNGVKIISIDNTKSESLVDSLKIFFPNDGNRDVVDFYLQPFFNVLYSAFCNQKDAYEINTEKGPLKVQAAIRGTKLFEELVLKTNDAYFDKDRILKKEITTDYGYYRFAGFISKFKTYKIEDDFYSLIKELNEKNTQNVIIDLRYNEGGDPQMGGRMMEFLADKPFRIFENEYMAFCKKPTYIKLMPNPIYFKFSWMSTRKNDSLRELVRFDRELRLSQPDKDRFKGHIYIITGSVTKSASTMFCKWLVGQSNVTFVGEETSGAINYFWAGGPSDSFVEVKLPNLKTIFAFGIVLLELKDGSSGKEMQKGLIPDQKIQYSIQDRLAGKDLEMEWIKNDIANKKKN